MNLQNREWRRGGQEHQKITNKVNRLEKAKPVQVLVEKLPVKEEEPIVEQRVEIAPVPPVEETPPEPSIEEATPPPAESVDSEPPLIEEVQAIAVGELAIFVTPENRILLSKRERKARARNANIAPSEDEDASVKAENTSGEET